MKKQLLSLGAIFAALLFAGQVMAQEEDILQVETCTPTVDGVVDQVWNNVTAIDIAVVFTGETPSITSATWKALWDGDGVYVLLEVDDDVWAPSWVTGVDDWQSDKPEIYFDSSDPIEDGTGASAYNGVVGPDKQFAPNFPGAANMGTLMTMDVVLTQYAAVWDSTDVNYVFEYFVPYQAFSIDGSPINPAIVTTVGFDVTIIDNDNDGAGRQRVSWANDGSAGENWNDLDGAGLINFTEDFVSCGSATQELTLDKFVNPTVATTHINVNVTDGTVINVYNSVGALVLSTTETTINVSNFAAGVYFVTAGDNAQRILVK